MLSAARPLRGGFAVASAQMARPALRIFFYKPMRIVLYKPMRVPAVGQRQLSSWRRVHSNVSMNSSSSPAPTSVSRTGLSWLVSAIVGVNCGVYLLWQDLGEGHMHAHFALTRQNVETGGAPHTLLASAFAHGNFLHIGVNMLALVAFGETLFRFFGPSRLLALYLGGALVSAVTIVLLRGGFRSLTDLHELLPPNWLNTTDVPT